MKRKNQLVLATIIAVFANLNTASACRLAVISGPMLSSIILGSPFLYSSQLSQAVAKGLSGSLESLSSFKSSHSNGEETTEERNNRVAKEVAMARAQADDFLVHKGTKPMGSELRQHIKNYQELLGAEQKNQGETVVEYSDLELVEGYQADMHKLNQLKF